jgi:hypothetical protein
MSTPGPAKIFILAMTLLLAMPLLAQRYQGRDHHVFHPPIQQKHQSASNTTPARVSSTGSPAARSHQGNPSAVHSGDSTRWQIPSTTSTMHPQ